MISLASDRRGRCWRFLDFILGSGRNAIREWYDGLPSAQARADFDARIDFLQVLETWQPPSYRTLVGRGLKGLGEIRFNTDNVQYRVIGFMGPGPREFTLLLGCTHKQNVYKPPDSLETAAKRKKLVESGEARTCDHST